MPPPPSRAETQYHKVHNHCRIHRLRLQSDPPRLTRHNQRREGKDGKLPKVFISYSHDSDEHRAQVLALSERLRADGIETRRDQYLNGAPLEGWPRWMRKQLNDADYALIVCTETYYQRFWGEEEPGKGKGVDWEATLITQEIYDARNATLKFIPVIFAEDHQAFIPEPLRRVEK